MYSIQLLDCYVQYNKYTLNNNNLFSWSRSIRISWKNQPLAQWHVESRRFCALKWAISLLLNYWLLNINHSSWYLSHSMWCKTGEYMTLPQKCLKISETNWLASNTRAQFLLLFVLFLFAFQFARISCRFTWPTSYTLCWEIMSTPVGYRMC